MMSDSQRMMARHALGLPSKKRVSYRNIYVSFGPMEGWEDIVKRGLATLTTEGQTYRYALTRPGAEMALDDGESLDPEDFPS
jgi:hypothetical protein